MASCNAKTTADLAHTSNTFNMLPAEVATTVTAAPPTAPAIPAATKRSLVLSLLASSLPAAISFTSSTLSNTLAFVYIGTYHDADVQAGHGLGYSIGNILVLTVGLGLVNGLDTLCPLAIGANRREYCWTYLFQALAVILMTVPFLLPLVIYSEGFLLWLHQDPVVAHLAAEYLIAGLPALFCLSAFEAARKFLVYHGYAAAHAFIALSSVGVQIFFLHAFIALLRQGAVGAGWARSWTWGIIVLVIYGYIAWNRKAFGWSQYRSQVDLVPSAELPLSHTREGDQDGMATSKTTVTTERTMTTAQVDACPQPPGQDDVIIPSPITLNSTGLRKEGEKSFVAGLERGESTAGTRLKGNSVMTRLSCCCQVPSVRSINTQQEENEEHRARCSDRGQAGNAVSNDDGSSHDADGRGGANEQQIVWMPSEAANTARAAASPAKPMNRLLLPSVRSLPGRRRRSAWWRGIPGFLAIAIPSAFLCIFEWTSFEAQIFLAAYLGSVELASLAASASLGSLIFILSMSIAVILNRELGRAVGANRPDDAKRLAYTGVILALGLSCPLALGVIMLRFWISRLFSQTLEVQLMLQRNLCLQAVIVVLDALHVILGGEIKALNLQWYGCIFDGFGLIGIMQTAGISLAFLTSLQSRGFLLGTIMGLSFNVLGYCILLFACTNWQKRCALLSGMTHSGTGISSQHTLLLTN